MNISHHIAIAFVVRVGLLIFGRYQDLNFVVKYTDVDYSVYTDAAHFLWNGSSPYNRQTYRYSPVLALVLSPNIFIHESFGKVLFSIFDVCTGYLIYKILMSYSVSLKTCQICSILWLYNPLCAVVSTRGSSDSVITMLILLCVELVLKNSCFVLGLIYGFSVHFRLYPCIYSLAFYSALSEFPSRRLNPWAKLHLIICPNKKKVVFVISTMVGFALPTAISYQKYGTRFIEEAFLYHLVRRDIKHNFSPYFYFMYLMEHSSASVNNTLLMVPFGVQSLLLLAVAWVFGTKRSLPITLFLQTYIFVTFNKVCTSQYFLWYLSLLPLNVPLLQLKLTSVMGTAVLWFVGQAMWLLPAYYLEFQGENTFLFLWISSLGMFSLNIYLGYCFCKRVPVEGFGVKNIKNE